MRLSFVPQTREKLVQKTTLRVLVLGGCLIPVLALRPPAAGAALVSVDLHAPGDGLVTRDGVSGLDWLDPSESTDLSFNQVIDGANGLIAAGWRHAVTTEVCGMLQQIGSLAPETCPFQPVTGDPSQLTPYTDLLGFTADTGFSAFYEDGTPGWIGRAYAGINTFGQASMWVLDDQTNGGVWASPDIGHFLVRPTPEPTHCDDGTDNDNDGLVDTSDPGCDNSLDRFEQNCGKPIPLTGNGTEDAAPAVSESDGTWHPRSKIAWHQWDGEDYEILLWDGSSVTPLTDNALHDMFPAVVWPNVVWHEWGAGDSRILLWTGPTPVPLSEEGVHAWSPDTDGSGVVWSQGASMSDPPEGVYHWDGSQTARVFGSAGGMEPAISGNSIVWETSAGIHMWTGSVTALIPASEGGHAPAVWGIQVAWHASDGNDDEIYLWNGSTAQQLTYNEGDDRNADLSEDRVVWESAEGIQVWRGGTTSLIAGSLGGQSPKIDGLDVVWQGSDGSDNEIYLATLCVQCNDGADNDGDAKIDYDGGLSALGYVAAEADPQCTDKPWRDREKKHRSYPCGLGVELVLLLPPLMSLSRRRRRSRQ